jgi:hypothetical protein
MTRRVLRFALGVVIGYHLARALWVAPWRRCDGGGR